MLFSWCRIEVDRYIVEGEADIQNKSESPRADWARMDLKVYPKIKTSNLASRWIDAPLLVQTSMGLDGDKE